MEMSPFEAARKLLSFDADALSLSDQMELVFQDMDLVPLLVQVRMRGACGHVLGRHVLGMHACVRHACDLCVGGYAEV